MNTVEIDRLIAELSSTSDAEMDSDDSNMGTDNEDVGASTKRYFLENSGPTCFNCGGTGHVSRDCEQVSALPCNLCGLLGHSRFECPQEVCYNCHKPGHHSRDCTSGRRRFHIGSHEVCNRCEQPGHLAKECSMSWRGYVLARALPHESAEFVEELRGLRKRCYNCASLSHFGDDCPSRRRPVYSTFHIPDLHYLRHVVLGVKKPERQHDKHQSAYSSHAVGAKQHPNQSTDHSKTKNPRGELQPQHPPHHKRPRQDHQQTSRQVTFAHNHGAHQENDSMRRVFTESRGISEGDRAPVAKSFVKYEGNRVQVPHASEADEESMRKGSSSSSAPKSNKPLYRGGYRR